MSMENKLIFNTITTPYQYFFENSKQFQPLVFYGAGGGAMDALFMFQCENAAPPVAICDKDSAKWGTEIKGIPILSLQEIKNRYDGFYVFVTAPAHAHEIVPMLENEISKEKILFFTQYEWQEIMPFRAFLKREEENLKKIYALFADEYSKSTWLAVLNARSTGDYRCYKHVFCDSQYFGTGIFPLQNECFLDVGTYDGDTIRTFITASKGKYEKIIGIEPHPALFQKANIFAKQYENIKILNLAAGEKAETLYLSEDASEAICSKTSVQNMGSIPVSVCKLDDIIKEPVTFIKMDIEGFEMQALHGARRIIQTHKPKLAICVYHKFSDFLDIPRFILSLDVGYRIYLRHHSYYMGETVLYAVCEEN